MSISISSLGDNWELPSSSFGIYVTSHTAFTLDSTEILTNHDIPVVTAKSYAVELFKALVMHVWLDVVDDILSSGIITYWHVNKSYCQPIQWFTLTKMPHSLMMTHIMTLRSSTIIQDVIISIKSENIFLKNLPLCLLILNGKLCSTIKYTKIHFIHVDHKNIHGS